VTFALDTTCSAVGTLTGFAAKIYYWSNKIKEGRRTSPDVGDANAIELQDLRTLDERITNLGSGIPDAVSLSPAFEIARTLQRLADNLVGVLRGNKHMNECVCVCFGG
jgi:hypothetical protein